jgi:hypothetical protein
MQQLQREIETDRQVAQQRQQLQQAEQNILNQIQAQQGRIMQLQFQNDRAAQSAALAANRANNADNRPRDQLEGSAEIAAANASSTIQFNNQQQRQIESAIGALNSQLGAARQRAGQLPPEVTPAQILEKQQRVNGLEQQVAQLKLQQTQVDRVEQTSRTQLQEAQRREQALANQLEQARGSLRQAQGAYQAEIQRQTDAERRQTIDADQRAAAAEAAIAASTPVDPESLSPEQQAQLDQVSQLSAQVRTDWLQLITEQQKSVQTRISELTSELQQVREALALQPPSTDRAGLTSFATAYAGLLGQLTQDFVALQINQAATTSPLERFGEASEPVVAGSLRRMIPVAAGIGMGLGFALAYLLDLRRQRRQAALQSPDTTALAVPTAAAAGVYHGGYRSPAVRRAGQASGRIRRRRPASA